MLTQAKSGRRSSERTIVAQYAIDHVKFRQKIAAGSEEAALLACEGWVKCHILELLDNAHATLVGPNGNPIAELYTVCFLWRNRDEFAIGHLEMTQWFFFARDPDDAKKRLPRHTPVGPMQSIEVQNQQGEKVFYWHTLAVPAKK